MEQERREQIIKTLNDVDNGLDILSGKMCKLIDTLQVEPSGSDEVVKDFWEFTDQKIKNKISEISGDLLQAIIILSALRV